MRVVGGWRPAQHVEAGVAAQDFREVGALGLGLQVDLDVDARQVGGHRLADLRVVHVTIVRAVHGDFEAAAVAGIGHQLLGGFDVVGRALVLLGAPAVDAGADHQRSGARGVAHHGFLDAFDVDRLVERLAHALVLERVLALDAGEKQLVALLVHAEEDGAQLGAGDGARAGVAVDARNVLHRHRLHDVDLAREQRRHARGRAGDGREDGFTHVALDLAPVVGVAHEGGAHARLALAHVERAGAVGLERRGVLDALAAIDRARGVVLFAPLLAHDHDLRQHLRQDGERRLGLDLDRVTVDLAHFLEVVRIALHVRAIARDARHGEQHVVGGEGRAVVELDVLAQIEAPQRGRHLLPACGQAGHDVELLVQVNQRLVGVAGGRQLQRLVQRVRVERERITLVGDAHGLRRCS